jgi:glycosyltransferase involved in cell wall biosynthesis
MKKFVFGVFFDHTIKIGGNFTQSLNNIFLAARLISHEIDVKIITDKKDNLKILKEYDIKCFLYSPSFFSRIWMNFREKSPILIYRLISLFFKKNNFEKFLYKNEVDLVYFVSQSHYADYLHSINYIFTLFDLCHRDNPEFPEVRANREFEIREKALQNNLSRAIAVLVDSDLGKKNVIHRYRLDDEKVHIFPFGNSPASILKKLQSDNKIENKYINIKKKYDLEYDYIFYPANFWSHKNHIYILKALNILKNESSIFLGAIFSGSDQGNLSYIKEMTKKLNLENQVRIPGFVPDEEKFFLYLQSLALVMPTYFGPTNIPPLEAFQLNVPVLYSDLPGLRDQVKEAALLLNLNDPKSLVSNLKKLLNSNKERNNLINKGKIRYNEMLSNNHNDHILKKIIENFKTRRGCWK